MRIIRIIFQIIILYVFYYAGVLIVELTNVPLPASVIGLLLLFIALQLKWIKVEYIKDGATFLIGIMTLFFIPPMLGIIEYPELLSLDGIILMVAVLISTLFAILITSICSQWIEKKEVAMIEKKEEGESEVESNYSHQ